MKALQDKGCLLFKKIVSVFLALTVIAALGVVFTGCSKGVTASDPAPVLAWAEPMMENCLVALNEKDYVRFSRDFDSKALSDDAAESKFPNYCTIIEQTLGQYQSKTFWKVVEYEDYRAVYYYAHFEKSTEPEQIVVKMNFQDKGEQKMIIVFSLESELLRDTVQATEEGMISAIDDMLD
jgi:hypothetical protein